MHDSRHYIARQRMKAQELNLDNIANNLANANTVGYKCGAPNSRT